MRMRTAMHLVKNPHVDSTMPVSPTKTAPLQPTSLQPNPSQLNPTQHNSTCLHPIRPTGAIPTLPNVPEDQASENLQPFIQPRVDMEVEMEMGMKVGERGSWSWGRAWGALAHGWRLMYILHISFRRRLKSVRLQKLPPTKYTNQWSWLKAHVV